MPKVKGSSDNAEGRGALKKGDNFMRSKSTISRLKMYRGGKLDRTPDGKITGGEYLSRDKAGGEDITGATGRVQPDRRWFGNTRVIGQKELDSFREAMEARTRDPYSVVLHTKALPMGLLTEGKARNKVDLLSAESFSTTFGPKALRKRVKVGAADMSELANSASHAASSYTETTDTNRVTDPTDTERGEARAALFDKGTSRRIWGELYKVLDCSDVVVQVLDARDPAGTRSGHVEKYLREHARHKHLVFVLNKCDLVPTWVTRRWVAALSTEYPTLAFHASLTHPFGKGALIALLRQFAKLHADKKSISVGFIGYPNVGKSSIINSLRGKKVCTVAPIPGETKVWQYVNLMKRVALIDCPGIVYPNPSDSESDIVLKGVVRAEKLESPEDVLPEILRRVRPEHMAATYGIARWADSTDFLSQLASRNGRLLKGGEADISVTARSIVFDWQRGKLPYYAMPPAVTATGKGASSGSSAAAGGAGAAAGDAAASGAAAEGGVDGSGTMPLLRVEQAIPRLGAHALLEGEEEEEDRKMAPVTSDDVGQDDDADDDEEEAEDNDDDGAEEAASSSAAAAPAPVVGGKRRRPGPGDAAAAGGAGAGAASARPVAKGKGKDKPSAEAKAAAGSSASAGASASASAGASAGAAGKVQKASNGRGGGSALGAGAGAKRRRVEREAEVGGDSYAGADAADGAAAGSSGSSKAAVAAAGSRGSVTSTPGVVLSLADLFSKRKGTGKSTGKAAAAPSATSSASTEDAAAPSSAAPAAGKAKTVAKDEAKVKAKADAAALAPAVAPAVPAAVPAKGSKASAKTAKAAPAEAQAAAGAPSAASKSKGKAKGVDGKPASKGKAAAAASDEFAELDM